MRLIDLVRLVGPVGTACLAVLARLARSARLTRSALPARPVRPAGLVLAAVGAVGMTGAVPPVPGEDLSRDLTLTTVHDGPFEAGGTGVFSVDVVAGRHSPGITHPTGVTYHFPVGLTPLRARGAGWTCRITVRRLGCGTGERAAPGFQLPRITIEVAVAPDATGTLTVSGRAVQTVPPGTAATATVTGTGTGTGTGQAMDTVARSVQVLPPPAP